MFSVLTLNLRFGLANDGPNSWKYRRQSFPSLFAEYRPDFIGFQEANDFQVDFLDSILAEYNFIGKRSPAPAFWQNNVIFYSKTWECTYKDHFFLSPTPTIPSRFRDSRWPRQCTIGMFEKERHQVICANTHFDFEPSVQNKSAELILEKLSHLPPSIPAVLLGDFNASPSSTCHNIFTGAGRNLSDPDRYFTNVLKEPFIGTHHGFTGQAEGDPIDWILYRGKIMPKENKIIQEPVDGNYLSDHFPLWASFEWKV